MEWFAIFIPLLIVGASYILFARKLVWWESLVPMAACAVTILLCRLSIHAVNVTDNEYWGNIIVEARYYESWSTWVKQTCSYTTTCCCDDKGNNCQTTTHYYDCSYCDKNSANWIAISDSGQTFSITKEYYEKLRRKWNSTPRFVELNRDINYHDGILRDCGKDGDMYYIRWDGRMESSEACVTTHNYTNKVQAAHTAFKLPKVTSKEAKTKGLYEYPSFYDHYKQKVILGLDSLYSRDSLEYIETLFQYFNGKRGAVNKIKLFVCLFYDKPLSIAHAQQAYWKGGNQNELVICMSVNRQTKEIQWVEPFSWTENKRLLIDCREDIAELKYLNPTGMYSVIDKAVEGDVHRDFKKDFNYLTIEMPKWGMWLTYILTGICSILLTGFMLFNEIENTKQENLYHKLDFSWIRNILNKIKRI